MVGVRLHIKDLEQEGHPTGTRTLEKNNNTQGSKHTKQRQVEIRRRQETTSEATIGSRRGDLLQRRWSEGELPAEIGWVITGRGNSKSKEKALRWEGTYHLY